MSATDFGFDEDTRALEAARELDKQKAAEKALGGDKPPAPEAEGGFTRWMKNLPKNVGIGLIDAALNTLDAVQPEKPDAAKEGAPQGTFTAGMYTPPASPAQQRMGLMDDEHGQAVSAVVGFRNELARGSRTSDSITQGVAQFVVPFTGYMKAFQGVRATATAPKLAQTAGKVGQAAAAESATVATAFDPHAGRLADLVEFGKHTEGKLADALNALSPDGSAVNAYFDYMTSREDESDAEGRFKNVVDSLAGSAAIASVIKVGAKSLRSARAFSESPITLPEIGAPEHLAREGQRLADEALAQFPDSPHAAMVQLTEQADNVLDDDIARGPLAAAAEKVRQGLPDTGVTVVPSPEGHTIVVGKQPLVTFLDEKDAVEAVADYQRQFGQGFQKRATTEQAKASDANFSTLHSFSRVLAANKDRPVSTHSMLSALERNLKGDTETGAFYKELLGRLVRKKLGGTTTVVSKGRGADTAGHFATAFNAIELYEPAFSDPKRLVHTFAHEAVHAATMHEMHASAGVMRKMEALRKEAVRVFAAAPEPPTKPTGLKRVDETNDAFDETYAKGKQYGFKDAYEFVAEIESNPEFRKLMQKTQIEGSATAWDKYLETIAGILGIGSLVATPTGLKEFSKLMMGPKQEEKPVG